MEFKLKNKKGAFVAKGYILNPDSKRPGLMLKAGSRMYKKVKISKKWKDCPWIEASRTELINNNLVDDVDTDYFVLTKDVHFSSPNRAACAMLGYITTNAWHDFVNDEGLTLDQVYRNSKKNNHNVKYERKNKQHNTSHRLDIYNRTSPDAVANSIERSIYQNAKEIVLEQMDDCVVPLDEYLNPLSDAHVDRMRKIFEFDFNVDLHYTDYVFARFVSSWQNGQGKGFIDENEMGKSIKILLCYFDLNDFISRYGTKDCLLLFNEVSSGKEEYKPLYNGIRRKTDLMYFCEGIFTISKILHHYKKAGILNKKVPYKFDDLFGNRKNVCTSRGDIDYLVGMSWTLYSDAVKESGLIDMSKPDVHIVKILNEIHNIKMSTPESKTQLYSYNRIFNEIARKAGVTAYELDKVYWLFSSGNYYLENHSKSRSNLRDQNIRELKKRLSS